VNSIYDELSGTGTWGSSLQKSTTAKHNHAGREQNSAAASAQKTVANQNQDQSAKPVRGVVLEFATRMRQSRGREELLSD